MEETLWSWVAMVTHSGQDHKLWVKHNAKMTYDYTMIHD